MITRFTLTLVKIVALLLVVLGLLFFAFIQFGPITSPKVLFNAMTGSGIDSPAPDSVKQRFSLPAGFHLSVFARDLPKIRFMQITSNGDLLVTRPRNGEVLLLKKDADGDGHHDGIIVLLANLHKPHGIDIWNGWLYVAESNAIGRVQFDASSRSLGGEYTPIISGLSDSGNHWTKSIGIGPDNQLYVSTGSSCNVCEETDRHRAAITRYNIDGSGAQIIALGLRNSVGLDWTPWDNKLYATDNGRDLLGDDFPPCELNEIISGGFYGFPYINGFSKPDPDYGEHFDKIEKSLKYGAISPAFGFNAHVAPLGIKFLNADGLPAEFKRSALVALHGSWNRSSPDGYKVLSLHWDQNGSIEARDFLSGFEHNGDIIGRPVDITQASDGDIFISDDYSGTIYRVSYDPDKANTGFDMPKPIAARDASQSLATYDTNKLEDLSNQGKALYQRYSCFNCHEAARAKPNRSTKSLEDVDVKYNVNELSLFFTAPTPPMPLFPLNENEREALAVYLINRHRIPL